MQVSNHPIFNYLNSKCCLQFVFFLNVVHILGLTCLCIGVPCRYVSPIEGFSAFGEVKYEMGCGDVACKNDSLIFPAMEAAREADATILVVGLDLSVESEGRDRVDLLLPGYQNLLINQVSKASKGPVILVIMTAGGVDISFAKESTNIQSILWAGYPGQEGGRAIADIVFGKHNPGENLNH